MSTPVVTRRAAAALFLRRQWLDRPLGRRLTAANLRAFTEAACGLQIDSVQVIERAHLLTLWSRFGHFDRARLERWIYRDRVLFEYLAHVACFVSTGDLPIWRGIMAPLPERWRVRYPGHLEGLPVAEVERAIAAAGVMGNADFERPAGQRGGGWWTWKPAMHVLDFLWKAGRIGVHSRVNFQKRYAPMHAVLPQLATTEPLAPDAVVRARVLRSLTALGVASVDDLAAYWTWPRMPVPRIREALAALAREGEVAEVEVEGQRRPWWLRTADRDALARAARARRPSRGTVLLSPFDSLLWHRERVSRLWGYHYRIEIYVPREQRAHGYYTLPILHEGQMVGRADLKTHRDRGVLELRHAHFEPWLARGEDAPLRAFGTPERDAVLAGLARAVHALARFVGAERVAAGRVTPRAWARPLGRALREAARG